MDDFRWKDFYKTYVSKGGTLTREEYKAVIQTFLKLSLQDMLEGRRFHIGYGVGSLKVERIQRNSNKPVVDWGASNKYKAQLLAEGKQLYNSETGEGVQWLIYFTDDYFYRYSWKKPIVANAGYANVLHNIKLYKLKPFAKAKIKLTNSINDMSKFIFDMKPSYELQSNK